MEPTFAARDYAATVRAVRQGLRLLGDLPEGLSMATPAELAAIFDELATWKHGVPGSALPTFHPKMAARRIVEGWPLADPVRQVVVEVYESARTPLP